MKKITLLCLLITLACTSVFSQSPCDYNLVMADSYGDGWNGNSVDVYVDSGSGPVLTLDDQTITTGFDGTVIISNVSDGDVITTVWNATGDFGSETSYYITDNVGTNIEGTAQDDLSAANGNAVTIACITPPDPPSNISCATADTITCGETISTNSLGSTATPEDIGCAMGDNGVWYTFVGTGFEMTLSVDAGFDHKIGLAEGTCGSLVNIVCDDQSSSTEIHTFDSVDGVVYYAYIAHYNIGNTSTGAIDITLDCATCVNPTATFAVVNDCDTSGGFLIDIDVTDLGSATSVTITDDQGSTPVQISTAQTVQFGDYANATDVVITITNDQDGTCNLTSATLTQASCPAANDDFAGAIPITPSTEGTGCPSFLFTYTSAGTTDSGMDDTCAGPNTGLDRFFTWTATSDGLVWNDGTGGPGIAIWNATGSTVIDCITTNAAVDTILEGWAIGDNLVIQIYDFQGSTSDISFCLEEYTLPTAPANDDFAGAIPITPSTEGTGCPSFLFTYTSAGTTDSGMDDTCAGPNTGLDRFFTWTATSDGLVWNDGTGGPGIAIWNATGSTVIDCITTNAAVDTILEGWAIGDNLVIQIYDFQGSTSDISFCLEEYTLPTAPMCAESLIPLDLATDVVVTEGFIDVFWSAPSTGVAPTGYDLLFGTTSGVLTNIGSFDATTFTVNISGIAYSTTYFWSVVPTNDGSLAVGCDELEFTTEDAPPPPANDDLCGAIPITVGDDGVSGEYTNIDTSTEVNEPNGSCYSGGAQNTVWFEFTAATTGDYVISTDIGGTLADSEIALYAKSGVTCADLSTLGAEIACDQDGGVFAQGYRSIITASLTTGDYYVQVSGYSNASGTFGFEVKQILNDDCVDAVTLELGTSATGDNTTSTVSADTPACNDSNRADIWYTFNSGALLSVDVILDSGYYVQVWEGTCGSLTQVTGGCGSTLDNLAVSTATDYYLQVWSDTAARAVGPFNIVIQDAVLSLDDNIIEGFSLYPNPVNDRLHLNAIDAINNISIYNLLGQEVMSSRPEVSNTEVDMSNLPTGMYIVKVKVGEQLGTYKVVKK